jgi:hypothetical protein
MKKFFDLDIKESVEFAGLLVILPFVFLYHLLLFLLLTSWFWAIPVALLIWAIK